MRPKLGIRVVELTTCRSKFIATLGGALKYVFCIFIPQFFGGNDPKFELRRFFQMVFFSTTKLELV